MIGSIIGDIVGSRFERNNYKAKDFELFNYRCHPTDDSIMTLAVAQALLLCQGNYKKLSKQVIECMRTVGGKYMDCGYGSKFKKWLVEANPQPYNSFGNGAAMRISAVGHVVKNMSEAKRLSKIVTEVTHNHPEGIKGAEAVAVAIYLARTGKSMLEIRDYIDKKYYPMNFALDGIRENYRFDASCQGSVPQAMMAFFESTSFEDCIRNAISIGGNSDTIAAIAGGIAEAYYGVPTDIRKHALTFLDEQMMKILVAFENKYPPLMEKIIADKSVGFKRDRTVIVKKGGRAKMIESAINAADKDMKNSVIEGEETTSQYLFSHLFEACNIMRGPINQDEFKSYITPILFFKRISDVYDEEREKALEESGGDEEFADFPENHSFIIPEGCHWRDIRETTEDVGKAIVTAMNGIERENPETLMGVFSSFDDATWTDKSKLSDERLKNLIEHMSKLRVGNKNYSADVMGDAYEFLIKKFADLSKKNAGEFYTPRAIVKLMVRLLDPKPGNTIVDPACGTGGMLIEAIRHIADDKMTYGHIYGQEKNLSTSAIARMNLFLHGARDFKVVQGDTLRDPKFVKGDKLQQFDCVLANPPFSLKKWGADQFESDKYGRNIWGCPTDSNGDFAWLQHMVASMDKKNGKCAVVLPQGVLFKGSKNAKMRKKMVEEDILECVIALAGGVFYSTGVSACILFLNKNKRLEHQGKVCLIDASNIYVPQRAQKIMSDENVQTVYDLYSKYQDRVEQCKIVTIEDIEDNDYTLSVSNYIEKKPQEIIPPAVVRKEYYQAVSNVRKAEDELEKLLTEGGFINEQ